MNDLNQQHVLVLGLGASGLAMARWCASDLSHPAPVVEQVFEPLPQEAQEAPESDDSMQTSDDSDEQIRQAVEPDVLADGEDLPVVQEPLVHDIPAPCPPAWPGYAKSAALSVTVIDTRQCPPQLKQLEQQLPGVKFVCHPMDGDALKLANFDGVLKSPGLSPSAIEPVIQAAQEAGLAVGNELTLFAQALQALKVGIGYQPKVIAITGTNGKTTVTSLTGHLVERAGKSVAIAGNIGPTLLDTLSEKIQTQTLPDVWVLELSSFQLDQVSGFEPTVATVLNVTQDHLDWHGSMQAYKAAKANVYGQNGAMLINRDEPGAMDVVPALVKGKQLREVITFGAGEPTRPGDYGIQTVGGMRWLVRAAQADETIKRRKDEEVEIFIQRLMPVDALRIHGTHNATNALAALALATHAGCNVALMLHGLREYKGQPHRLESVAVVNGIEYFDDSKGTNVGATVAALEGLGGERKLVVILGGEGKEQDFTPLQGPVKRNARAVVLIGRDAPIIEAALKSSGVTVVGAASMRAAVELATQQAQSGDAVLLSPACASFDMFDNYEHRGQVFAQVVRAIAQDAGSLV